MSEVASIRQLEGKYRILAELGQGGTAQVFLAIAHGLSGFNKLVVLKAMKPELRNEPELARMFLNEARLAARLNHPNIVQTNEVFEHDGLPVIVMEYLDGQALSAVLTRDRNDPAFPLSMQLRVLSEALGGLHAAHELIDFDGSALEVVHCDISPHNIFVTYDGLVKVLDFGIATLVGTGDVTESGVIKGKLHYMSPEQIVASGIDSRADVYAAGVILWEMAAGERMWRGLNEAVIMNRILNGELPNLFEKNPHADPYIKEMIGRATALDPEARYASAADFQLDLDEYLAATSPHLRPKDVGGAVSRMFQDHRKERQHIIEQQLARVVSLTDDEYQKSSVASLPTLERKELPPGSLPDDERAPLRWLVPWLLVVALLGVMMILILHRAETPLATVPMTVADAPTKPARPPLKSEAADAVRLRVTAFPAEAQLIFDGDTLGENPYLGTYARDPKTHHSLIAKAPGFQAVSATIVLSDDQEHVLTLQELKAGPSSTRPATAKPPKPPSSGPPKATPTAPTASAAPALAAKAAETATDPGTASETDASTATDPKIKPAAAKDCQPPYFFDERGVKKYKPGCLSQ